MVFAEMTWTPGEIIQAEGARTQCAAGCWHVVFLSSAAARAPARRCAVPGPVSACAGGKEGAPAGTRRLDWHARRRRRRHLAPSVPCRPSAPHRAGVLGQRHFFACQGLHRRHHLGGPPGACVGEEGMGRRRAGTQETAAVMRPNPASPLHPPTQPQNKLESVGEALDGQGQAMEMAGGSRTLPEKGASLF